MSEAFKCDRCHELFTGKPEQKFITIKDSSEEYNLDGEAELCASCTTAILRAIDGSKVSDGKVPSRR